MRQTFIVGTVNADKPPLSFPTLQEADSWIANQGPKFDRLIVKVYFSEKEAAGTARFYGIEINSLPVTEELDGRLGRVSAPNKG